MKKATNGVQDSVNGSKLGIIVPNAVEPPVTPAASGKSGEKLPVQPPTNPVKPIEGPIRDPNAPSKLTPKWRGTLAPEGSFGELKTETPEKQRLAQELASLKDKIGNLSRFDPNIGESANKYFEDGIKLAGDIRKEYSGNIPSDIATVLNNLLLTLTTTYDAAARRAMEQNPTIKMQTASSLYSRVRKFEGPNGVLSGTNEQPFPDLQKLSSIA